MSEWVLEKSPPLRRPLTRGLLNLLRSVTHRPFDVVNVPAPDSGAQNPEMPYGILYPVSSGSFTGGEYASVEVDGNYVYQVTSVGGTYDQCEWLSDRVRLAILGRTATDSFAFDIEPVAANGNPYPTVVMGRESESGPGDVSRAQQGPVGLYTCVERFRIYTTPLT
jgi:hypothetical protein